MRKIKSTNNYKRGRKRCQKRGLDMRLLDKIEDILVSRPFTQDEIVKYKVHKLSGKWSGYMELHIGHKRSDWLLVYRIEGDTVVFEDTYVVLENTGTHDECLGSTQDNNDLVWL